MRNAITVLVLVALVALASLTFVKPDAPTEKPVESQRIVSLAPSLTEVLIALGAKDRVVGATVYCTGIEDSVARVGSFLQPDFEAIIGARPDVVLAIESKGQVPLFEALGRYDVPVEQLPGDTIEGLYATLERLGGLVDASEKAAELTAGIRGSLESRPHAEPAPSVLFVVDHRPMYAAGRSSFVHAMLEAAGARNAVDDSAAWVPLEMEDVIRLRPDVIVDCTLSDGPGSWESFSEHLEAVRAERVFPFPQVHVGVQIPDWISSLRDLLGDTGGE